MNKAELIKKLDDLDVLRSFYDLDGNLDQKIPSKHGIRNRGLTVSEKSDAALFTFVLLVFFAFLILYHDHPGRYHLFYYDRSFF